MHARGSDVNPTVLKMAAANFRHLAVPYRASWEERPTTSADASAQGGPVGVDGRCENRLPHRCDSSSGNGARAQTQNGAHDSRSRSGSRGRDTFYREEELSRTDLSSEEGSETRHREERDRTHAIDLSKRDALQLDSTADCLVTNLPYNRFLEVSEGDIEKLVRKLRDCAQRFVFFAGAPLQAKLQKEGYEVITEVDIGRRGKRYMSWARSKHQSSAKRQALCTQVANV